VLEYSTADHDRAQNIYKNWNWDLALDDLDAGKSVVSAAGQVAMVGFCWGGTLAWLAACRRGYAATVAYYGSMMLDFAQETARCPVIAHIGTDDATMPPQRVESFHNAQPNVPINMYPGAQHGFDNPSRTDRFHPEACKFARERTIEFLARHVG
jgi:carboxymethylenebutenolidase